MYFGTETFGAARQVGDLEQTGDGRLILREIGRARQFLNGSVTFGAARQAGGIRRAGASSAIGCDA